MDLCLDLSVMRLMSDLLSVVVDVVVIQVIVDRHIVGGSDRHGTKG